MGFLESTAWKLFSSPPQDVLSQKSPKLLATPSYSLASKFSLPSGSSSSSSSASSLSSSSTFWRSRPRTPPRWSVTRYVPSRMRSSVSKRQIAVVLCFLLALFVWCIPPPFTWTQRTVHLTIPQEVSNPYQVLRPTTLSVNKHAPDPGIWLEHSSNDRYALNTRSKFLPSIRGLGRVSSKPRAALISLVRNSELGGLIQSMRQLEYHWNRKYQYPWIFFNDEPFSDDFKVC